MELSKAKNLENLFNFGRNTNNTSNSNDEDDFFFGSNIDLIVSFRLATIIDSLFFKLKKKNKLYF